MANTHRQFPVAPPVGAWIETDLDVIVDDAKASRPPWARGLKPSNLTLQMSCLVAPPVGAWIETIGGGGVAGYNCRAPRGRVD